MWRSILLACGTIIMPVLSHPAGVAAVRERRLACISFSLAWDAKKKSMYRPVFALVDESHLCGFRILIQVSILSHQRKTPIRTDNVIKIKALAEGGKAEEMSTSETVCSFS